MSFVPCILLTLILHLFWIQIIWYTCIMNIYLPAKKIRYYRDLDKSNQNKRSMIYLYGRFTFFDRILINSLIGWNTLFLSVKVISNCTRPSSQYHFPKPSGLKSGRRKESESSIAGYIIQSMNHIIKQLLLGYDLATLEVNTRYCTS